MQEESVSSAEQRLSRILQSSITAAELCAKDFPEIRWTVPGLLPEGLAMIAGKPKTGKSWLALNIATAVSAGTQALGKISLPSRSEVLYLALEDTERRIRSRLDVLGAIGTDKLHFVTSWSRGPDALMDLRLWLQGHDQCRVVIVDTLGRIREPRDNGYDYQTDSDSIAGLKQIADARKCTIILIHHTRKLAAEDYMDLVSGTTGITGAADTVWVLQRPRTNPEATLSITGRDIEESELALRFDLNAGGWSILGPAAEHRQSLERQEILRVLGEADEAMTAKAIAELLEKKPNTVTYLLGKLEKEGFVMRSGYGRYTITHSTHIN